MISPFVKQKMRPLDIVSLPSYCVPAKESNDLAAKREAQLEWMRQKGLAYLGDPLQQSDKKPLRRSAGTTMRLVRMRKDAPASDPVVSIAGDG